MTRTASRAQVPVANVAASAALVLLTTAAVLAGFAMLGALG